MCEAVLTSQYVQSKHTVLVSFQVNKMLACIFLSINVEAVGLWKMPYELHENAIEVSKKQEYADLKRQVGSQQFLLLHCKVTVDVSSVC